MQKGTEPREAAATNCHFLLRQGEASRHASDDDFFDDDEDGLNDPPDLYHNGDMDDIDHSLFDEEAEQEMHPPVSHCVECGDEIGFTEQLCMFCSRKAFRLAGAPLHH